MPKSVSEGSVPAANIDVIVLTYNEERNLEQCLVSVQGLVRNIFVVDTGSEDRTVAIAQKYGARVVRHEFTTQAVQFNWALDHLPVESKWVLRLDADEYLLPQLRDEITQALPSLSPDITGLYMKRRMIFMGRWIRHGGYYPTWILRLFRKGKARCEEAELNEHIVLSEGRSDRLKNDFVDQDHDGLTSWLVKHEGFAGRQARFISSLGNGKHSARIKPSLLGNQVERKRWLLTNFYRSTPPFLRAYLYFFYRYFFRLGFLDGVEGLIFHFLHGCWYPFYTDAKLREQKLSGRLKRPSPQRRQSGVVLPFRSEKLRNWAAALLLSFGILLSLGLLEGTCRVFAPSWLKVRMKILNPGIDLRKFGNDSSWPVKEGRRGNMIGFIPESHFQVSHYEYNHSVHVDSRGTRRTESCSAQAFGPNVAFVGDSMTFGLGVNDFETYVSLLGKQLGLCLINMGIPGSSLRNQVDMIEERHQELGRPSLYLINFFLGNDLKEKLETKKRETQKRDLWLKELNSVFYHHWFLRRIYVVQFVRARILSLYNSILFKMGKRQRMDGAMRLLGASPRLAQNVEKNFRRELRRLTALSRKHGFKVAFVLVPDKSQIDVVYRMEMTRYYTLKPEALIPDLPNRIVGQELQRSGIPFVDPLQCLRKKQHELYFVQDNHFNSFGHEAMSQCVSSVVSEWINQVRKSNVERMS